MFQERLDADFAIVDASHESARRRNLKNRMDRLFEVVARASVIIDETPPLSRAAFSSSAAFNEAGISAEICTIYTSGVERKTWPI
jgi:hypothetical protein